MRLDEWRARRLARRPEYAEALAEVDFAQTLADAIVDARIRAGLTQTQLAEEAKTTQARISELEVGLGNPTRDTIGRVVGALTRRVPVSLPIMAVSAPPQEARTAILQLEWAPVSRGDIVVASSSTGTLVLGRTVDVTVASGDTRPTDVVIYPPALTELADVA